MHQETKDILNQSLHSLNKEPECLFMVWKWLRFLELDACAELLENRGLLTQLGELRDANVSLCQQQRFA